MVVSQPVALMMKVPSHMRRHRHKHLLSTLRLLALVCPPRAPTTCLLLWRSCRLCKPPTKTREPPVTRLPPVKKLAPVGP